MDTVVNTNMRNIVVIGASAGGIETLRALFSRLPAVSGASYFVVQHMAPHYASEMDRILQKTTAMQVAFARDGQRIMPDTVYLAPPDRHLALEAGHIRVTRGPRECRARPAVDVLFRSAALAFGPRVIGIVLTGALDDGTAGLWQIKDRKGLAFVQDPEEALYNSMPESAIEHVDVDCIGTIDSLAAEVVRHIAEAEVLPVLDAPRPEQLAENAIALEGNGMQAGIMNLGHSSKYTCPECHGVLAQIQEGSLVRFRCHTGHAYSPLSLQAEVITAIDESLWNTLRAIEERILLLRQRANMAGAGGDLDEASQLRAKADMVEERCQPLRELVLDSDFFSAD